MDGTNQKKQKIDLCVVFVVAGLVGQGKVRFCVAIDLVILDPTIVNI